MININDKKITVEIDFYDKNTESIVDEVRIDLPEEIVFAATESRNVNEINSFMYAVSEEMKDYVMKHYPEHKDKFGLYLHDFIGRHGLGEGY